MLHDLALADERADGHAVSHGLTEAGKVRCDADKFLHAAESIAEAGNDLVHNEDRASLVAELAAGHQEIWRIFRFDNDSSDLVADSAIAPELLLSHFLCVLRRNAFAAHRV